MCNKGSPFLHRILCFLTSQNSWDSTTPDGRHNKTQWRERIFYHQIWSLIRVWKGNSTTLQPGNYEFPFSVSLHKRMPASIEGMDDCYIRYGLTAALNCSRGLITESRNLTVSRLHDIFSFVDPQVCLIPKVEILTSANI